MSARSRFEIDNTTKKSPENKSTPTNKRKSVLQDRSNKKKRTPTADDSNQRDRSSSVISLPSSRESEGSLEAELPSHAFSSDSENGDDNTNPPDNDEMINEPAPVQPTSDTAAPNTSINTQATSSTVPDTSAQAADISINTQAVSGIDTISTLQDNDKVKIERLV